MAPSDLFDQTYIIRAVFDINVWALGMMVFELKKTVVLHEKSPLLKQSKFHHIDFDSPHDDFT
jgi:hypothetical protein